MRYLLLALVLAGCTSVSVTSPDGKSTITYKGTTIMGSLTLYCHMGTDGTTCGQASDNIVALAQAVAPLVGAAAVPKP